MKYLFLFTAFSSIALIACGDNDDRACITCNSSQTMTFAVCEESNGNASVNGDDTGTSYSDYIEGLRAAGATCGE
jgi:hypothetical protein